LTKTTFHKERLADHALIVDLIHRAVVRILEGEGNEPPAASSVTVINRGAKSPINLSKTYSKLP
jgi:hypothetical protein